MVLIVYALSNYFGRDVTYVDDYYVRKLRNGTLRQLLQLLIDSVSMACSVCFKHRVCAIYR